MFWVLLGFIGVMLFVITFMKEPKDKQDERQVESYQWVQKNKWKLRIIGIILCWIGVGVLTYKEEAKNIQEDIQKETPKTFGKLEDFEKKLQ
jgi:preprotein translocase subunit Sec63